MALHLLAQGVECSVRPEPNSPPARRTSTSAQTAEHSEGDKGSASLLVLDVRGLTLFEQVFTLKVFNHLCVDAEEMLFSQETYL